MKDDAEYIGKYSEFIRTGMDMYMSGQKWRLGLGQKMTLTEEELLKAKLEHNQKAEEKLQHYIKDLKKQLEELEEQLEEQEELLE